VQAESRIEFRVGINVGDIISDGSDIYGDGVNLAARLEALAEPGGIYVSRVVHDQVRDKLSFADGISEDIITALSKLRWFFVIARNSSFTYKGMAVDVKKSLASSVCATSWRVACERAASGCA
jgi:hypothetical protein